MLRVEYKSQNFLFTADIREALEEELFDDFGDVDVLKLSHHGSDSANGEALLEIPWSFPRVRNISMTKR